MYALFQRRGACASRLFLLPGKSNKARGGRGKTELTPHPITQLRQHGLTLRVGSAVFGLCGGMVVAILGSLLSVIAWITGPEWHGHLLQRDGTILLFLTIPLLVFGAHCLDLVDRKNDSQSVQRYDEREKQ
jgi:hypothetical protein